MFFILRGLSHEHSSRKRGINSEQRSGEVLKSQRWDIFSNVWTRWKFRITHFSKLCNFSLRTECTSESPSSKLRTLPTLEEFPRVSYIIVYLLVLNYMVPILIFVLPYMFSISIGSHFGNTYSQCIVPQFFVKKHTGKIAK